MNLYLVCRNDWSFIEFGWMFNSFSFLVEPSISIPVLRRPYKSKSKWKIKTQTEFNKEIEGKKANDKMLNWKYLEIFQRKTFMYIHYIIWINIYINDVYVYNVHMNTYNVMELKYSSIFIHFSIMISTKCRIFLVLAFIFSSPKKCFYFRCERQSKNDKCIYCKIYCFPRII